MKNIKTIFSYVVVAALISGLILSCKNDDKTGGGGGVDLGSIPTASGSPATVGNAEFSGTLNNASLVGNGWTKDTVDNMVMQTGDFGLLISDNKVSCAYITQEQLLCPDSSKPNVVEASQETVLSAGTESETTFTAYIKITLDNADNPTTATVEYYFKLYSPEYSGSGMSDTVVAKYEGTLNKVTSGS